MSENSRERTFDKEMAETRAAEAQAQQQLEILQQQERVLRFWDTLSPTLKSVVLNRE